MKEHEIRPKELFNAYLTVAKKDIGIFFSDQSQYIEINCPACDSSRSTHSFNKHGMSYRTCVSCESLYMSPRPTRAMIDRFYKESESSKFWAERFFPETAEPRRAQIFRPRAEEISELIKKIGIPSPRIAADIGAGYGLFLEELESLGSFDDIVAIEPGTQLAKTCKARGFRVIEKPVEDVLPSELKASLMTSFEVLEHLFAPVEFLETIRQLMIPGGLFIFTTLTSSGWDIQTLWEKSKSVSPPHHINLLSIEGITKMVERAGWEVVDICTPGKIDVDIVANMLKEDPNLEIPRFAEYLLKNRDTEAWDAFQTFLQNNRLSSHVRVVARPR